MELPEHIAERIRQFVATTSTEGYYVDCESARHGGVSLMGTIGATWLLRPDGSFWDVDDDSGRPITPLAPEWHVAALRWGARSHPWLAEIVPSRPPGATDCDFCRGEGDVLLDVCESGIFCPTCCGRGWRPAV